MGPHAGQTQSGTAVLTAMGSQTLVVLNLATGPAGAGVDQPAHIHDGQCPGVAGVKYSLTNVKDGKSTTTVNATLDSLMSGSFAINVHKSNAEVSVYTSCGNVGSSSGGSSTPSPQDDYNYNSKQLPVRYGKSQRGGA